MKKENKNIWWIVGIIIAFLLFSGTIPMGEDISTDRRSNILSLEGTDELTDKYGNKIDITIEPCGTLCQFSQNMFAVELSKKIIEPGERITISWVLDFEIPSSDYQRDKIFIQIIKSGRRVDAWSQQLDGDICHGYQCYWTGSFNWEKECFTCLPDITITQTFTAPIEPGDYIIQYQLKDTNNNVISSQINMFRVVSVGCPSIACGSWKVKQYISYGEIQGKTCTKYTSEPQCDESFVTEYHTYCDSGYVIKGTDSSDAIGKKSCVSEQAEISILCYACENNMMRERVVTDIDPDCPSGYDIDEPPCGEETTISCYKCIGEELEEMTVIGTSPSCDTGYSQKEPDCIIDVPICETDVCSGGFFQKCETDGTYESKYCESGKCDGEENICEVDLTVICEDRPDEKICIGGETYRHPCVASKAGIIIPPDYIGECEGEDLWDTLKVPEWLIPLIIFSVVILLVVAILSRRRQIPRYLN